MFSGSGALLYLRGVWRRTWNAESATRAGLISVTREQTMEADAPAA